MALDGCRWHFGLSLARTAQEPDTGQDSHADEPHEEPREEDEAAEGALAWQSSTGNNHTLGRTAMLRSLTRSQGASASL